MRRSVLPLWLLLASAATALLCATASAGEIALAGADTGDASGAALLALWTRADDERFAATAATTLARETHDLIRVTPDRSALLVRPPHPLCSSLPALRVDVERGALVPRALGTPRDAFPGSGDAETSGPAFDISLTEPVRTGDLRLRQERDDRDIHWALLAIGAATLGWFASIARTAEPRDRRQAG